MHGGCVCGSDRYRPTCSYGRQSSKKKGSEGYAARIGGSQTRGQRRGIADLRAPTDAFSTIFGRRELRIGPSRTKNCEEVDFEVRKPPNPPNLAVKRKKYIQDRKSSIRFVLFVEN